MKDCDACGYKRDGCGFDYQSRERNTIFSFPSSSNETTRGVEFRHSHNDFRIQQKTKHTQ